MRMDKEGLLKLLKEQGHLKSPGVIRAFEKVPRENFVPVDMRDRAYENHPLPIGKGQTISQPLTVADMTEALDPEPGHKVLEVGSGSGYQAAILSEIVGDEGKVFTVERIHSLAERARKALECYENVEVTEGDGSLGYEKGSPFDRIIVTASAPSVPEPLKEQLNVGGKMVIPVGGMIQAIIVLERKEQGFREETLGHYSFVPLVGKHGFKS